MKTKGFFFNALLTSALLLYTLGCSDDNKAKRTGQTVISGSVRVEGQLSTNTKGKKNLPYLSFLRVTKQAIAEEENIFVTAFQNGVEVDHTLSDTEGNYSVTVPGGGSVTLLFEFSGSSAATIVNVTPDSKALLDVVMVLSSQQPEIQIETFAIISPSIRTRELESFTFREEKADFRIEGNNANCLEATGSSEIEIRVKNLTLTGCNNGIVGEDFANVLLETVSVSNLNIEAKANGIHAKDDSSIRLKGNNVYITADINGILATGTSGVQIEPSGSCTIQGREEAVDKRDAAFVDTANCTLIKQ
jgi:hypothetical protein